MNPSSLFPHAIPRLQTPRLALRELVKSDIPSLYSIWSDPQVAEFDDYEPYSDIQQAELVYHRLEVAFQEQQQIPWAIQLEKQPRLIGTISLKGIDDGFSKATVSFDLAQHFWGKGFGTEALGAVVEYASNHLAVEFLEAYVHPKNTASQRVLEKNNFHFQGHIHRNAGVHGEREGLLWIRHRNNGIV